MTEDDLFILSPASPATVAEAACSGCGGDLGVPWSKGDLKRGELAALYLGGADDGSRLPLQSRPAAYWPDGSIKWSLHSAVCPEGSTAGYTLERSAGQRAVHAAFQVSVEETEEAYIVDTGSIRCTVVKHGPGVISRIIRRGTAESGGPDGDHGYSGAAETGLGSGAGVSKLVCSGSELVCLREQRDILSGELTLRQERFTGVTLKASLEEQGPVRAVIRLDGRHRSTRGPGNGFLIL